MDGSAIYRIVSRVDARDSILLMVSDPKAKRRFPLTLPRTARLRVGMRLSIEPTASSAAGLWNISVFDEENKPERASRWVGRLGFQARRGGQAAKCQMRRPVKLFKGQVVLDADGHISQVIVRAGSAQESNEIAAAAVGALAANF